ncbi:hypothetical protein Pint_10977 [Pistacia integerrima]|uniref:Uncharacterized protein n=1 Tax=Pistacia integerrima TaxID=434235 RepID=A0ACC0XIR5_9ROSI|nr:hypothetical protein Pint_10977 [Pistacia integerrima]
MSSTSRRASVHFSNPK